MWALRGMRITCGIRATCQQSNNVPFYPEFSSPSAAAAVIHGGHANGLTVWKNKDGKTLKELESE